MLRREESRHDFAFIAGAIVGAAAGAIATLALAPGPGSDTREKVKQRVATLDVETVKQRAASASSTARDAAQRGKERVTEIAASRGESSADGATSIKERAASVTGMARDAAQRGKERVTEIAGARGGTSSVESTTEDLSAEPTAAADDAVDIEETISEETLSAVISPPPAPDTPASDDERPSSS